MALTKISTGMLKQDAASSDLNIDAGTLYLDVSNNRVGVANTSPQRPLHVVISSGTTPTVSGIGMTALVQNNSSTASSAGYGIISGNAANGSLFFGDAEDADVGRIQYEHNTNAMTFRTNASERMRLDSSGNVGIGNNSPSTFDGFSAAGNLVVGSGSGAEGITIYTGTSSNGALCFADGTTSTDTYKGYIQYNHSTDSMQFATGHTERMRIDSSGQVGIGGSPSGKKFEVIQDSGDAEMRLRITDGASNQSFFFYGNYTGPDQNIYFGDSTNTAAAGIRYSHSVDAMRFTGKGSGSEMARFDSSGDLIVGGTSSGANDAVSISNTGYIQAIINGDTAGYFNRRTSDGEIIRLQKDGTTVGSIATNSSRFELDGSGNPVRMKAGTSNIQVNNNTHISFDTAGGEAARFDSSGNFGIGLTSLGSAKFEVYPGTAANTGAIRTSYGSAWMNIITNLSNGGFNPVSLSGDMGIIFSLDSSSSSASSNGFVIAPWSTAAGGIRIKDNGYVGISVSNASYPLDVKGTIQIQNDGGSGYTHSRLITQSTNAARGSGMFMHNTGSDIEWYAGRPYSSADNFVIARQGTASHSDSTAQLSNSFVVVTSSGNLLVGQTSSSSSTYKFETSSDNSTGARINTVSLGRSSSGYPIVGYNCAPTTTVNTYNKVINDYASWFHFVSGRIDTYTTTTTGTGTTTGTAGPYLSSGGTSWTSSSDSRLKDNIESISYGLEAVKSLNPVSYVRNDRDTGATELGFIAQEVDEVVSEVVSVKDNGYYGIDYERLIPVLTKAIQEQQEIIENLKSRIEQLEQ